MKTRRASGPGWNGKGEIASSMASVCTPPFTFLWGLDSVLCLFTCSLHIHGEIWLPTLTALHDNVPNSREKSKKDECDSGHHLWVQEGTIASSESSKAIIFTGATSGGRSGIKGYTYNK